jgi:hypothetical protein
MRGFAKLTTGAAVGAGMAYLLDPQLGRTRRARLADQIKARGRRMAAVGGRKARYQAGRIKGLVHEAGDLVRSEDGGPLVDDATLLQKVRSEVVGPSGIAASDLSIQVDDGVVVLRGPRATDQDLEDQLLRLEGVRGVRREMVG